MILANANIKYIVLCVSLLYIRPNVIRARERGREHCLLAISDDLDVPKIRAH